LTGVARLLIPKLLALRAALSVGAVSSEILNAELFHFELEYLRYGPVEGDTMLTSLEPDRLEVREVPENARELPSVISLGAAELPVGLPNKVDAVSFWILA
jgi:hypothetical protein